MIYDGTIHNVWCKHIKLFQHAVNRGELLGENLLYRENVTLIWSVLSRVGGLGLQSS